MWKLKNINESLSFLCIFLNPPSFLVLGDRNITFFFRVVVIKELIH